MRGGGLPSIGSGEIPFTQIAPSWLRLMRWENSLPYPNVPLAVHTGFWNCTPAISISICGLNASAGGADPAERTSTSGVPLTAVGVSDGLSDLIFFVIALATVARS